MQIGNYKIGINFTSQAIIKYYYCRKSLSQKKNRINLSSGFEYDLKKDGIYDSANYCN
jgi:hypothetical protein